MSQLPPSQELIDRIVKEGLSIAVYGTPAEIQTQIAYNVARTAAVLLPSWRTMETAPRNPPGTMGHRGDLDVDLWHTGYNKRLADCFWWAERNAWFSRSGGMAFNMGGDDNFSHWCPKPSSPAIFFG